MCPCELDRPAEPETQCRIDGDSDLRAKRVPERADDAYCILNLLVSDLAAVADAVLFRRYGRQVVEGKNVCFDPGEPLVEYFPGQCSHIAERR